MDDVYVYDLHKYIHATLDARRDWKQNEPERA